MRPDVPEKMLSERERLSGWQSGWYPSGCGGTVFNHHPDMLILPGLPSNNHRLPKSTTCHGDSL